MRGVAAGVAFAVGAGVLGAQQFAQWSRLQLPQASDAAARFVDLDGDGDLDILAYPSNFSGPLHVYENQGYGHFRVDPRFTPSANFFVWASIGLLVGDVDGDGRQDVVASSVIVRNRGALGPIAVPHNLGETPFSIGDFNGDGRQDLATYGAYTGTGYQVSVWLAAANFTFTRIPLGVSPAQPTGGAAGDLDGDGLVDLVVATNGVEFAMRNTGGGNLVYMQSWLPGAVGDTTNAIALADFDRDGDLDLATYNGLAWAFRDNEGTGRLVTTARSLTRQTGSTGAPHRMRSTHTHRA